MTAPARTSKRIGPIQIGPASPTKKARAHGVPATLEAQPSGAASLTPTGDRVRASAEGLDPGEAEELEDGIPDRSTSSEIVEVRPHHVLVSVAEDGESDSRKGVEITVDARHYFGPELIARFNKINTYYNFSTGTFSIHNVPLQQFRWGGEDDGFLAGNFLYRGRNRVVLWIVGDISYVKFVADNGEFLTTPFMGVTPLLDEDFATTVKLLNGLASPPSTPYVGTALWASRFLSPTGTPSNNVKHFRGVFDAQETYESKTKMRRMPCEDLKVGDVVVLEATVRRWRRAEPLPVDMSSSSTTTTKAGDSPWKAWKVGLRMEAVSLLYKGSDFHVGEVPDEHVSF